MICCLVFYTGAKKSNVISSSFTTKPSGSTKSLQEFPGTSRELPTVFNKSSKAASSSSLRSSRSTDDTSELSGLSQLLSSQDVVKSGRHVSYFPNPSMTTPHRHEVNSRHQELMTMLAELGGSSTRLVSPSAPSLNSTTISFKTWVAHMQSPSLNEPGKRSRRISFCLVIVSNTGSHKRLKIYL